MRRQAAPSHRCRRRRRRSVATLLAGLLLAGLLPGVPPVARAAEYNLVTAATYTVQPDERRVAVAVDVTFENTTPDPAGQFSVFEVVDLAIHEGATDVSATDDDGRLNVSVGDEEGFLVASVRPRQGVRYEQQTTFRLSYLLPDGAAGRIRVRPSLVTFPVWSFGTAGRVTVTLPEGYEISVDGDELTAERTADGWSLDSGEVSDPAAWLSQLVALGPATYRTVSHAVPLASGTVDLQVRHWADDEPWGQRTLELLADALPLLEETIGLPYPEMGPLVVSETVSSPDDGLGEASAEGTQIMAAFDQDPFALLHQAAHVWLSEALAEQRWIREGFASWAAAEVGAAIEVEPSFDPQARAGELGDQAFPLVSWGAGETSPEQDAFAYAASWVAAAEIADAVGEGDLRHAWQRIASGIGSYEPPTDEPPASSPIPGAPVDARTLLDQLEAVSGADVAAIFERWVLDEAAAAKLEARSAARESYARLLAAAGSWGSPEPVQADMAAWRFESAEVRIAETLGWLTDRDELMAAADRAGLSVPKRLRDRYRTAGGGSDARTELDAEAAVVGDYQEVRDRAAAEPGLLERLGLLGGPQPVALLADAASLFGEGDLRGAADSVAAARARLDRASTDGAVRLLAAAAVIGVLVLVGLRLAARRRRALDSGYTAPP